MARVNADEVVAVMDTALTVPQIAPFITLANTVVTDNLGSSSLSADTLKQIELMLAAHFARMREQGVAAEKIGDVSMTYQGKTGMGLDATQYGQAAKMLDTTGTLSRLGAKAAIFETIAYSTEENPL